MRGNIDAGIAKVLNFSEVQVGHDQNLMAGPIHRPIGMKKELTTRDRDLLESLISLAQNMHSRFVGLKNANGTTNLAIIWKIFNLFQLI